MKTPARAATFKSVSAFRAWLTRYQATETELIVRCFKVAHARRGLTYRDALDEALCFGWIDGVRRALDAESFTVRFSPRKRESAWSRINIMRFKELQKARRVRPPGQRAFDRRTTPSYSYESRPQSLAPAFVRLFRTNARAWAWFDAQPPWYRRACAFWVMEAKRPETRRRRLKLLMEYCRAGQRVPPFGRDARR